MSPQMPDQNQPLSPPCRQRGACLLELKPPQYSEAIKELSASLAAQPGNRQHLLSRAKAYLGVGDISRAGVDANSLLAMDPHNQEGQKIKSEIEQRSFSGSSTSISPPTSSSSSSTNMLYSGAHFHYACDQCGTTPICGYRYESARRRGYDLCPSCMANQSQSHSDFRPIPPPEDANGAFLQSLGFPNGVCSIRSEQQRIDLLWKASESGNPAAMCELALAYQRGKGVPREPSEAVRWLTLASVKAYPYAQHLLGKAYLEGLGTSLNAPRGRGLIEAAANSGHADAQLELAECLLAGRGGPADLPEGVKWLRIAAEGGHAGAQRRLGKCYSDGCGVARDHEQASKWYTMADRK